MNSLRRVIWAHPEWSAAAVVAAAWLALLDPATANLDHLGMTMQIAVGWSTGGYLAALGTWTLMSTAMMLPPALPTLRQHALSTLWHRRQRTIIVFSVGFLLTWATAGALALAALDLIRRQTQISRASLGVLLLLLAAGWETTPWKLRAIRTRHLLLPLPLTTRAADRACAAAAVRHASWCLASCLPLMLALAENSWIDITVMAVLTALITTQSLARSPASTRIPITATISAIALATFGI